MSTIPAHSIERFTSPSGGHGVDAITRTVLGDCLRSGLGSPCADDSLHQADRGSLWPGANPLFLLAVNALVSQASCWFGGTTALGEEFGWQGGAEVARSQYRNKAMQAIIFGGMFVAWSAAVLLLAIWKPMPFESTGRRRPA
jgi:hypothetical protein